MICKQINITPIPDRFNQAVRYIFLWFLGVMYMCTAPHSLQAKKLSDQMQQKVDSIFFDGIKAMTLENPHEALMLFKQVVKQMHNNASAHYYIARLYYQSGYAQDALTHSTQSVAYSPDNKWFLFQHSLILAANNKYLSAAKIQAELAAKSRVPKQHYYYQIRFLQQAGQFQEALVVLSQAFKKFKEDEYLIQLQQQLLQLQIQEWMIAKSKQQTPKNAQIENGTIKTVDDNLEKGIMLLKDQFEEDEQVQRLLVEYYIDKADIQLATQYLEQYILNKNFDFDHRMLFIATLLDKKGSERFVNVATFTKLSYALFQEQPNNINAKLLHAYYLEKQEDYTKSRNLIKEVLQSKADYVTAWQQLVLSYVKQRAYDSVIVFAGKAIVQVKNDPDLYFWRANAYSRKRNGNEAIAHYQLALKYLPVNEIEYASSILTAIGDEHFKMNNFAASDSSMELALRIHPSNIVALNNYSYYLGERNVQLEKAEEMSLKTIKIAPSDPSYLDTYARILYKNGKFDEAKKYLLQALLMDSEQHATILEHIGDVEFRLGNKQLAVDYWRKALQNGENSAVLHKKIKEEKINEP